MGMIGSIFAMLFGGGQNIVKDTVEVFRPNAEAQSQRGHDLDSAALAQMAAEFANRGQRGWFDQMMDGVNRLPRPMLVFSVFGILVWTPIDPIASAQVFTAWAIIPPQFWLVILAIVTFYFGGRHQAKDIDMKAQLVQAAAGVPMVLETIGALEELRPDSAGAAETGTDARITEHAVSEAENAALADWLKKR